MQWLRRVQSFICFTRFFLSCLIACLPPCLTLRLSANLISSFQLEASVLSANEYPVVPTAYVPLRAGKLHPPSSIPAVEFRVYSRNT
ncbi:hypothetical protein BKA65DRAFT_505790 [Rhexocercosporidium sp. MPI-PUGE-AT-0058]|nr:hypothetical protein BKA65DRAFT_505790 [Rhexocercosporidium sp. MPI-PUGE-AT-0058]